MTEPIKFNQVPISIFQQPGMNGNGQTRRVFIDVEPSRLAEVPDELFAVKVSQSKNPELAGKSVFKYFSYKLNENTPYSPLAPTGTTTATPTAETKAAVIEKLSQMPGIKFSVAVNMNGKFGNITTPEGVFTIFDDVEFPTTEGKPGYYVKSGSIADVELTLADSAYGPYYRVALSTQLTPDELFVKSGKSKVWGADDSAPAAPADNAGENDGELW